MPTIYLQLKESLATDIAQGRYQPGDVLPSETELMKVWSVSRITVRNAIKQLVIDGLAYTIHGKGTFVSEKKITNYLPSLTSLSHDVAKKGSVPKNCVLTLEQLPADKTTATQLHLSPGDPVIHFVRVTCADENPIAIAYTYVPLAAIAPHQQQISQNALENGSFYEILRKIGVPPTGGFQTISAAGANAFEAEHLTVSPGAPLIESHRVSFTRGRVFIEYTRMMARPDFIQWKVVLGMGGKDDNRQLFDV